jgi:hypothetical protein
LVYAFRKSIKYGAFFNAFTFAKLLIALPFTFFGRMLGIECSQGNKEADSNEFSKFSYFQQTLAL